jgi:hypothetical protein
LAVVTYGAAAMGHVRIILRGCEPVEVADGLARCDEHPEVR